MSHHSQQAGRHICVVFETVLFKKKWIKLFVIFIHVWNYLLETGGLSRDVTEDSDIPRVNLSVATAQQEG